MLRRPAILGAGTAILAMFLAFVSSASADPTHLNTFHLHGTNGYRIRIDASPSPGSVIPRFKPSELDRSQGAVTVTVSKGGATSAYSVPATVTRTRIKARFPGLGRIRAKFHPHVFGVGGASKREVICTSGYVVTLGRFKGRIRFRGEHGYTQVKRHSAPGGIGWQESQCSELPGGPRLRITELLARSPTTAFNAIRLGTEPFSFFGVVEREKEGRVLIHRSAFRNSRNPQEFSFDGGLTQAHVQPFGPLFSGSADYASGSWTGPLTISFPGEPNAPLTGPQFTAKLRSRVVSLKSQTRTFRTAQRRGP